MNGAGPLRDQIAFDRRVTVDDGHGNTESGDFVEQFVEAAETTSLKGTEAVMASRLTGIQPWVITVRCSPRTTLITTDWRARDTRAGTVFAISTVVTRTRRDYIDITCIQGKAA